MQAKKSLNYKIIAKPKIHINSLKQTHIQDVWAHNFEEELMKIINLVDDYNYIAMDTEFPGVVKQPAIQNFNNADFEYQLIKENVNNLKIIQLGISICDKNGNTPDYCSTWQFNFQFNPNQDEHHPEAIHLLRNSGIDFDKFQKLGIDPKYFSEFFIASGIILNEDVSWISFHGGFDFAYMLKMLLGTQLPDSVELFQNQLAIFFPTHYDIKYLIKDIPQIKNDGLSKLAQGINVERIGPCHQAGSDSLVTLSAFFKLQEKQLTEELLYDGHNILFGIGKGLTDNRDYLQKYNNRNNWGDYADQYSIYGYQGGFGGFMNSVTGYYPIQESEFYPYNYLNMNNLYGNLKQV